MEDKLGLVIKFKAEYNSKGEVEIQYELSDDGGSSAIWLPILLPIGTIFSHEYGTYKVDERIIRDNGTLLMYCNRVSKDSFDII